MRHHQESSHESGQIIIEAVLLFAVVAIVFVFTTRVFRDAKLLQAPVAGPWVYLQGMIESGVWAPPNQARALHPNNPNRQKTVKGDE